MMIPKNGDGKNSIRFPESFDLGTSDGESILDVFTKANKFGYDDTMAVYKDMEEGGPQIGMCANNDLACIAKLEEFG